MIKCTKIRRNLRAVAAVRASLRLCDECLLNCGDFTSNALDHKVPDTGNQWHNKPASFMCSVPNNTGI
ncbi:hypothetical protein pipiens_014282 [Culex pipiens pipiens]|uniref:Uncharacterized protein n=1 Tax=Culex pipiens pipiens TaxID=38569 RepID=A0ABD1CVC8_CULPP